MLECEQDQACCCCSRCRAFCSLGAILPQLGCISQAAATVAPYGGACTASCQSLPSCQPGWRAAATSCGTVAQLRHPVTVQDLSPATWTSSVPATRRLRRMGTLAVTTLRPSHGRRSSRCHRPALVPGCVAPRTAFSVCQPSRRVQHGLPCSCQARVVSCRGGVTCADSSAL